jgi:hypothetical protein
MTDWFENLGLSFANRGGSLFTENIGWGMYRCGEDEADCTGTLIDSIRTTYDFFRSEEPLAYRPHFDSMINPEYRLAGLGISVDQSSGKYYLTAHYATDIESDPQPVCP